LNDRVFVSNDPVNFVDPWGLAKYIVHYSIKSFGVGPATVYNISGIILSQQQNTDGTHQGARFSGTMVGVGAGLPVAYARGSEMCEDKYENADVQRAEGSGGMLSAGATTFGKDGNFSGGHIRLGEISGTNESLSQSRGLDIGIDAVGTTPFNKIKVDSVGNYSHDFYRSLGGE
jgi:hypothetical protein